MKNFLLIYAHPNPNSFNAAIKTTIIATLEKTKVSYKVIDLYLENYNPVMSLNEINGNISPETTRYQRLISESTNIIFIFPVFWFRAPAILEGFLDKVFVPKFAYRFKQIIGIYGIPIPLLKDKNVLAILSHGAPALPVKTIYVNAVKFRFLLGFLSFCFNIFKCRILQLWAVPFVKEKIRKKYLNKIEKSILKRV